MRIRLSDIPQEGRNINNTISLEALNTRMNEGAGNDIIFTKEPEISIHIRPEKGGAVLTGKVATKYRQPCPRCLQEIEHIIDEPLNLILKEKAETPGADRKVEPEEWEDDVGIIYFKGEHIDLEDIVQETVILAINPLGPQHEGCKSLEWKEEDEKEGKNTLGKLFEKAGVH